MRLLALFHPFSLLRRLPFLGALLLTLALGYGGLYALRFGGEVSFLGLAVFVLALWILLSILCNRTRDADASPGWVLFPVLITGISLFAVVKIGYMDFSDFILGPATTKVDKIATAPFRPFTMIISAFIPMMIGAVVSGVAWMIGFIGLAALPSRAAKR
jgi:hypothetical protein